MLDELRLEAGLSFRDLPRQAKALNKVLPASTVWDMLTKAILPKPERLVTYLLVCGIPETDLPQWRAAWSRIVRGVRSAPAERSTEWIRPHQLPADVFGFVGRREELAQLDDGHGPGVVVLSGPPGAGKTALAVHWAHRNNHRFPDGQLFLNLHGYSAGYRLPPLRALHRLLLDLGVGMDVLPSDVEHSAALLRSRIAGRQMLLVLDNVATPEQVRNLLPGGPGCLTLLTSRNRLTGLVASTGARHIPVASLAVDEAAMLIGIVSGRREEPGAQEALRALGQVCGGMPLALRMAGAKLTRGAGISITEYTQHLTEHGVMAQLRVSGDDETGMATALNYSYAVLPQTHQEVFQILAHLPGREFSPAIVAAAARLPEAQATDILEALAEEHLVIAREGRYLLHDLLAAYARDLTAADGHLAAVDRAYAWYLSHLHALLDMLAPQVVRLPSTVDKTEPFATPASAQEWFDRHQHDLEAAITVASRLGLPHRAWQLMDALRGQLMSRRGRIDWLLIARAGLSAAEDDPRAQAACHLFIGIAREHRGEIRRAKTHYGLAAELSLAADWPEGVGSAYNKLGVLSSRIGLPDAAVDYLERSLEIARHSGRVGSEALNLNNLATLRLLKGDLVQAHSDFTLAAELHRRVGTRRGEVSALINRGITRYQLGQYQQAREDLARASWIQHNLADKHDDVAVSLAALADVYLAEDDLPTALSLAQSALHHARRSDSPHAIVVATRTVAGIRLAHGQPDHATLLYQHALQLANRIRLRREEISALIGLALAEDRTGSSDSALHHVREADAMARQAGFRVLSARCALALSHIHRDEAAAAQYRQAALDVFRATGYRPDLVHRLTIESVDSSEVLLS